MLYSSGPAADRARVGLVAHLRQVPPVVEVRIQRGGVDVGGDPEEVAFLRRDERAEVFAQRRLHVVFHRHHFMAADPGHQPACGGVGEPVVFLGGGCGDLLRQLAVTVFFELQRGPGPVEFPLQQPLFVVPGQRHVMHVLQVPGVLVLADAGRPGLGRRLLLEPGHEFVGSGLGFGDRPGQPGAGAVARHLQDAVQVAALIPDVADAGNPQIPGVAGEIALCLPHERRNHLEVADHPLFLGGRQREVVGPQLQHRVVRRAFVRRHIALVGPDRLVVGRVANPWHQHAVIEIEAVHLGVHQVPVNLLCDGPAGGVDRIEPCPVPLEILVRRREPFRRVVGRAIEQRRGFEFPPVREEFGQRRVRGGLGAALFRAGRRQGQCCDQAESGCQKAIDRSFGLHDILPLRGIIC